MRRCKVEGAATLDCTGDVVEIRDCNTHPCPSEPHYHNTVVCIVLYYHCHYCMMVYNLIHGLVLAKRIV